MDEIRLNDFQAWEDLSLAKKCVRQYDVLKEIQQLAKKIDLKDVNIGELVSFVKRCKELTK